MHWEHENQGRHGWGFARLVLTAIVIAAVGLAVGAAILVLESHK